MTTIFQRITSSEFTISLFVAFLLLLAGKCFSQNLLPMASQHYTVDVLAQPEKARYSLRLEVITDAEIALSLHDEQGRTQGGSWQSFGYYLRLDSEDEYAALPNLPRLLGSGISWR